MFIRPYEGENHNKEVYLSHRVCHRLGRLNPSDHNIHWQLLIRSSKAILTKFHFSLNSLGVLLRYRFNYACRSRRNYTINDLIDKDYINAGYILSV